MPRSWTPLTFGTVTDCRLLAPTSPARPRSRSAGRPSSATPCQRLRHVRLVQLLAPRLRQPHERARGVPERDPRGGALRPGHEPGGIRCTAVEQIANQLGRDPADRVRLAAAGQRRRPVRARRAQGRRDHARAVRLAERERRWLRRDRPGRRAANRGRSDRTQAGLHDGRVNDFGLGLASTPIIDLRTYTDPVSDIHTRFWSFVARQRLLDANGTAANQVIFISNGAGTGAMAAEALAAMDDWLAAIRADTAPRQAAERTIRNRPADLEDCLLDVGHDEDRRALRLSGSRDLRDAVPELGDTRTAAGRRARRGRPEVPAAAARLRRLPGHVHRRAAGAAADDLPDRRLRLEHARRRRAATADTWLDYGP